MDLVDRYLHAIRRNLPAAKADDITAEIGEDIASRIEEREARLGRPLTGTETSALLKDYGHPLVVASRYRQHQWLIGPDVFPFYVATLRIVLLIVVAVVVAVGLGTALFGTGNLGQTAVAAIHGLQLSVMINLVVITIVFAVLDRTGFPAEHVLKWVPDQLPDIVDKQPGKWESAFEVALGIAFLLWWTGAIRIPYAAGGPEFRIEAAPAVTAFYWPILILAAVRLVHNLIQWLRPRWKALRHAIAAISLAGGLAVLAMLYRAGHFVTIVSTGMPADKAAELEKALNLALGISIVVVGVIWVLAAVRELWRLGRAALRRAG